MNRESWGGGLVLFMLPPLGPFLSFLELGRSRTFPGVAHIFPPRSNPIMFKRALARGMCSDTLSLPH